MLKIIILVICWAEKLWIYKRTLYFEKPSRLLIILAITHEWMSITSHFKGYYLQRIISLKKFQTFFYMLCMHVWRFSHFCVLIGWNWRTKFSNLIKLLGAVQVSCDHIWLRVNISHTPHTPHHWSHNTWMEIEGQNYRNTVLIFLGFYNVQNV